MIEVDQERLCVRERTKRGIGLMGEREGEIEFCDSLVTRHSSLRLNAAGPACPVCCALCAVWLL